MQLQQIVHLSTKRIFCSWLLPVTSGSPNLGLSTMVHRLRQRTFRNISSPYSSHPVASSYLISGTCAPAPELEPWSWGWSILIMHNSSNYDLPISQGKYDCTASNYEKTHLLIHLCKLFSKLNDTLAEACSMLRNLPQAYPTIDACASAGNALHPKHVSQGQDGEENQRWCLHSVCAPWRDLPQTMERVAKLLSNLWQVDIMVADCGFYSCTS